jgi:hypothetical protein
LKNVPKVHLEAQRPRIDKTILSKKSDSGNITIPDLKLSCTAIVIKTAGYWHKNRHEDQYNRVEDWDVNRLSYTHQFLTKAPKTHD